MLTAKQAAPLLGISPRSSLTPEQEAEVEAFYRASAGWACATVDRWSGKTGYESHKERAASRRLALRNAASAKRHAAKLQRTPSWADEAAIQAVYERARQRTEATGTEHHVDHIYPLQGRLVSGLHVHGNLQVLTGADNCRKNNRYEV